jgi:hypothetical protein
MIEFICGALIGGLIVYVWMAGKPTGPRTYEVSVTPTDKIRLKFIGTLNERDAKWLSNSILDGTPFTGPALVRKRGKGGRLTDNEYIGVRDDLVNRRAAYTDRRHRVTLLPPAFALFRLIAGRGKAGTRKERGKEMPID